MSKEIVYNLRTLRSPAPSFALVRGRAAQREQGNDKNSGKNQ